MTLVPYLGDFPDSSKPMMRRQIQGQQFGNFMDNSKPTMRNQMQGQQRSKDTMTLPKHHLGFYVFPCHGSGTLQPCKQLNYCFDAIFNILFNMIHVVYFMHVSWMW